MITYEELVRDAGVRAYIKAADESLSALGYTEHSTAHVTRVAEVAADILIALDYDSHTVELAKIAGLLHDIGNVVNRVKHSQSGALMAFRILDKMGMEPKDIAAIVTAIGNHDEGEGVPVSDISAALILADKSDVRKTRVRNTAVEFDIHDKVNLSVENSRLDINSEKTEIHLIIDLDTDAASVMEYFEIFLGRMIMCRKAAERLGLRFGIIINGQKIF